MKKQLKKDLNKIQVKINEVSKRELRLLKGGNTIVTEDLIDI